MKINEILAELEKIERLYRDMIITSNFKQVSADEISWSNYSRGIYRNLYAKEYEILVQNRQYSFLLKDKLGFIQFYFKYSNDGSFEKIKMAYYPYPVKMRETLDDIESYYDDSDDTILSEYFYDLWNLLNQEFSLPVTDDTLHKIISTIKQNVGIPVNENDLIIQRFNTKYEITNSSHIRIDFDNQVESHHKCEVQIGAVNNIRLPVDRIISPFIFFDFIIKNLYKEFYREVTNKAHFQTDFIISKKKCLKLERFEEANIFLTHLDHS